MKTGGASLIFLLMVKSANTCFVVVVLFVEKRFVQKIAPKSTLNKYLQKHIDEKNTLT